MIAYVIACLMGVAIGIVVAKVTDWVLPISSDEEYSTDEQKKP